MSAKPSEAWELAEADDHGNAVISPPSDTKPWWTAIVICVDRETQNSVARTMYAAPDLLQVAELLVSWLDEEEGAHALCDTARAAIRKATGST